MPENQNGANFGQELMAWQIPEYTQHYRSKKWYISYFILAFILLVLSLWTPNFFTAEPSYLFVIIIVLVSVIVFIGARNEPAMIDFIIASEGIVLHDNFYDYDMFKHFSVVFKPHENISVLYLSFSNKLRTRFSVPLYDNDPVKVRSILVKYVEEDLERTDEANTDFFGRILKI